MNLESIQRAVAEHGLDGWLFYDFANRDQIAYRILGLPQKHTARRWYYFVPAAGEAVRIVHHVEPTKLDSLPGRKILYLRWQEMHAALREALAGARRVAMQYSPDCTIPYVSLVDAGTVDLVRSFGVEVVSSADLVQIFEALVDEEGWRSHVEAGDSMHAILRAAWDEIGRRIRAGESPTEHEIQQFMLDLYRRHGMESDGMAPIVAGGAHAGDPHFDPTPEASVPIRPGDAILVDLWARKARPGSIYYDITWCGFVGDGEIPPLCRGIFDVVREARDRALQFVRERVSAGADLFGYEIDDACREVVVRRGYGEYFRHRTGHSIGREVHGAGVHIDNLETQDRRRVVPGCLFSIEPGIYMAAEAGLGVRTEIDVYVAPGGEVRVHGPIQTELVRVAVKGGIG
ncbi:MAG: M24 family metallopeptidase [Myxococcota bacterium]|nr:M24 family metallopeptidase [Myxococcota bacterium]